MTIFPDFLQDSVEGVPFFLADMERLDSVFGVTERLQQALWQYSFALGRPVDALGEGRVRDLRAEGKMVFVDFTASW